MVQADRVEEDGRAANATTDQTKGSQSLLLLRAVFELFMFCFELFRVRSELCCVLSHRFRMLWELLLAVVRLLEWFLTRFLGCSVTGREERNARCGDRGRVSR